ncbi:MAG TPA: hypothetical protein VF062_10435 [Candidatus Limnocylindrales bacterium]
MDHSRETIRLIDALDRELNADEVEADPIMALTRELGQPAQAAAAPVVRERLALAVRGERPYSYDRDVWAEVLAGMVGILALPDLLDAGTVDLGDDRDGFYAVTWELLDSAPDAAAGFLIEAAGAPDPRLRHEALYLATFLPPRQGPLLDALIAGLGDPDAEVGERVRFCVEGSGWQELPEVRSRLGSEAP